MTEGIHSIERVKQNVRYVHYRLTNWCNFKCDYCVQGLERQDDHLESTEYFVKASKRLAATLDYLQDYYPLPEEDIELIGGEISTLDLIAISKPLVERCTTTKKTFQIVTNMTGYKNVVDFSNYLGEKGIRLRILCSLHEQFMKPSVFWERFDYMKANKHKLSVIKPTFVVHDDNIDYAEDFLKECESRKGIAYAINIKREREGDARHGRTRPPYATDKTVNWLTENYSGESDGDNVIVNDTYTTSRRSLTNKYGGRIDTIGMLCVDRHKVVRFNPIEGLKYGCGYGCDKYMCKDIICPQECSLCSAAKVIEVSEDGMASNNTNKR